VQAFLLELESLASLHEGDAEKMAQLKALYLYAQELVSWSDAPAEISPLPAFHVALLFYPRLSPANTLFSIYSF